MSARSVVPRLLVVAGHDSSGGAGVDADRSAAERFEVEVTTVVTAWTKQAEGRVLAVEPRPVADWLSEAKHAPEATVLKSGLLPGADHVRAAAELLSALREREPSLTCVVDPVLSASGGEPFLDAPGIEALRTVLIPFGVHLTPNLPEAARLTGRAEAELAGDPEARLAAGRELLELGARAVLLKGGHGREDPVRDLVWEREREPRWIEHDRVAGPGLHGSGCRYASAVAAQLAHGTPLERAAEEAARWVAACIDSARNR